MDSFYPAGISVFPDIINLKFFYNPAANNAFSVGGYLRLAKDVIVDEFSNNLFRDVQVVVFGLGVNLAERFIGNQVYRLLEDPMNFGSQSRMLVDFFSHFCRF